MEEQGESVMEFGENDVFIAMEEGDLEGEELDDLDEADHAGTHARAELFTNHIQTRTTQWGEMTRTPGHSLMGTSPWSRLPTTPSCSAKNTKVGHSSHAHDTCSSSPHS